MKTPQFQTMLDTIERHQQKQEKLKLDLSKETLDSVQAEILAKKLEYFSAPLAFHPPKVTGEHADLQIFASVLSMQKQSVRAFAVDDTNVIPFETAFEAKRTFWDTISRESKPIQAQDDVLEANKASSIAAKASAATPDTHKVEASTPIAKKKKHASNLWIDLQEKRDVKKRSLVLRNSKSRKVILTGPGLLDELSLSAILSAIKVNKHIRFLKIAHPKLGDEQSFLIAQHLRKVKHLQKVDLSGNDIKDFGARALYSSLCHEELNVLNLSYNDLSHDAIFSLLDKNEKEIADGRTQVKLMLDEPRGTHLHQSFVQADQSAKSYRNSLGRPYQLLAELGKTRLMKHFEFFQQKPLHERINPDSQMFKFLPRD